MTARRLSEMKMKQKDKEMKEMQRRGGQGEREEKK